MVGGLVPVCAYVEGWGEVEAEAWVRGGLQAEAWGLWREKAGELEAEVKAGVWWVVWGGGGGSRGRGMVPGWAGGRGMGAVAWEGSSRAGAEVPTPAPAAPLGTQVHGGVLAPAGAGATGPVPTLTSRKTLTLGQRAGWCWGERAGAGAAGRP